MYWKCHFSRCPKKTDGNASVFRFWNAVRYFIIFDLSLLPIHDLFFTLLLLISDKDMMERSFISSVKTLEIVQMMAKYLTEGFWNPHWSRFVLLWNENVKTIKPLLNRWKGLKIENFRPLQASFSVLLSSLLGVS